MAASSSPSGRQDPHILLKRLFLIPRQADLLMVGGLRLGDVWATALIKRLAVYIGLSRVPCWRRLAQPCAQRSPAGRPSAGGRA